MTLDDHEGEASSLTERNCSGEERDVVEGGRAWGGGHTVSRGQTGTGRVHEGSAPQ